MHQDFNNYLFKMKIWKDINGFEGYYQVSNKGNVRSLDREVTCNTGITYLKGIDLKLTKDRGGYFKIKLSKNNKTSTFLISRLVAIHFIPNPHNLPEVNHLYGKEDNRETSLEWTSSIENQCYRVKDKNKYSSKYPGVSWNKKRRKWVCRIYYNKKSVHIGYFDIEEEAYKARKNFEIENFIINKY